MVQSSDTRGSTPRTLVKIGLLLGLALVGVAAMAAEPAQTDAIQSTTTCAETKMTFDGRIIENGEVTDTWTLTCFRQPAQQAAIPVPTPKPIDATPVATRTVHVPVPVQGAERF